MVLFITFLSYILAVFGFVELMLFFEGPFSIIGGFRRLMQRLHPTLGDLFSCPACLSSWVGIIFSTLNCCFLSIPLTPFNIILGDTSMWWLIIPLDCFLTAGTTWTLYQLDEFFEKNATEYEDDGEQ